MNFKTYHFDQMPVREKYQLLISSVIPRPIAWVSTLGKNGVTNLAPFSFYNAVSSSPPVLMVSITEKRNGKIKDTLRNILDQKEFAVNFSSSKNLDLIYDSSFEFLESESEFEKLSIESIPSKIIKAPRVKSSEICFECKLLDTKKFGEGPGSSTVVFGEILVAHMDSSVDLQNPIQLSPVSRLGGSKYGILGKVEEK